MKINRIMAVWLLLLVVDGVQAANVRYWNEGPLLQSTDENGGFLLLRPAGNPHECG